MIADARTFLAFVPGLQRRLSILPSNADRQIALQVLRTVATLLNGSDSVKFNNDVGLTFGPNSSQATRPYGIYWTGILLSVLGVIYWKWKLINDPSRLHIPPDVVSPPLDADEVIERIYQSTISGDNGNYDESALRISEESALQPPTGASVSNMAGSVGENSVFNLSDEECARTPNLSTPSSELLLNVHCSQCTSWEIICCKLQRELRQEMDAKTCIICQAELRNMVFLPCGHLCLCENCAKTLRQHRGPCPLCRKRVRQAIRVYF